MARTVIPIVELLNSGVVFGANGAAVAGDAANGMYIPRAGRDMFLALMETGANATVTVITPATVKSGLLVGVNNPKGFVLAPVTSGPHFIGPLDPDVFAQPASATIPGAIYVDLSGAGAAAFKLLAFWIPSY
jgi:hypothetical protein